MIPYRFSIFYISRRHVEIKEIIKIVEKPKPGKEPSPYATHGAYVFTPEVFKAVDKTSKGNGGELWLTDIIANMKDKTGLLAKIIPDGHYLDCGTPDEYLHSQVEYHEMYSKDTEENCVCFGGLFSDG